MAGDSLETTLARGTLVLVRFPSWTAAGLLDDAQQEFATTGVFGISVWSVEADGQETLGHAGQRAADRSRLRGRKVGVTVGEAVRNLGCRLHASGDPGHFDVVIPDDQRTIGFCDRLGAILSATILRLEKKKP